MAKAKLAPMYHSGTFLVCLAPPLPKMPRLPEPFAFPRVFASASVAMPNVVGEVSKDRFWLFCDVTMAKMSTSPRVRMTFLR